MTSPPLLLQSIDDLGRELRRDDVRSAEARDEAWLRDMLFRHPELLPVNAFDERFGPLVPVATELTCDSGRIDAIFASPHGRLTLVETKLWRNPERHRDVVGQIIGYARALANMDIAQLNDAVRDATPDGRNLDSIMGSHLTSPHTLDTFHEKLAARLPVADFLLLIVGDRISPNAAMLANVIAGAPGLLFKLGLLEMHMYPVGPEQWPLLVVPEIVGRTVERERFVVRIESKTRESPTKVCVIPSATDPESWNDGGDFAERLYRTVDDFLTDPELDAHTVDAYRHGFQAWRVAGGTLDPKPRYVYWMFDVDGEPQEVIRCQDYRVGLIRRDDWARLKVSPSTREAYLAVMANIPAARDAVSANKMLLNHELLSRDDITRIVDATVSVGLAMRPT